MSGIHTHAPYAVIDTTSKGINLDCYHSPEQAALGVLGKLNWIPNPADRAAKLMQVRHEITLRIRQARREQAEYDAYMARVEASKKGAA